MKNIERILWLITVMALIFAIGCISWENHIQWRWIDEHEARIDNNWKFVEAQDIKIEELQTQLDDLENNNFESKEKLYAWMRIMEKWMGIALIKIEQLENKFNQEGLPW